MKLHDQAVPPVQLRLRGETDAATEKLALKAALTAAHLLGLGAGSFLRQLRGMNDPLAEAAARIREEQVKAGLAWDIVEILSARLAKIPNRNRPHYTPSQRFRILEIKGFLGWSQELVARVFRVCSHTVANWERHIDLDSKTVGSTVKPIPPIRRFADVVRATIQTMRNRGFGGEDMIAQTLARAGWKVSARTVRRIGRPRPSAPPPPPAPGEPAKPSHPVFARFVHHTWMMDVTVIRAFLGGDFYLAGVFDAFSRVPLALQTLDRKPGAAAMARLLRAAVRAFGRPKYVITDLGKEFAGRLFKKAAARLGIVQRFCSKENHHATARLERFWRSLKQLGRLKLQAPLTCEDLEERIETALSYYLCCRPHQGLQGATPAEAFLRRQPACKSAISPPRANPGDRPTQAPFAVDHLDTEHSLFPILKPAA